MGRLQVCLGRHFRQVPGSLESIVALDYAPETCLVRSILGHCFDRMPRAVIISRPNTRADHDNESATVIA